MGEPHERSPRTVLFEIGLWWFCVVFASCYRHCYSTISHLYFLLPLERLSWTWYKEKIFFALQIFSFAVRFGCHGTYPLRRDSSSQSSSNDRSSLRTCRLPSHSLKSPLPHPSFPTNFSTSQLPNTPPF